jgi:RNA polymerase sigma-70 factor, ECF subfamily
MMRRADPASHAALIAAIARSRDQAAFSRLFGHYAPQLKAYLLRSGLEPASAEEIAQEVMLAVWRKASQFDPARATASAWIFSIASNLRIDAFRRSRVALLNGDPSDEPAPTPLSDALLDAEDMARRVHDAIGTLPPEQLATLQLAFFEDRSHAEIQALLSIPLGTIKSRLRMALAKLRVVLRDTT